MPAYSARELKRFMLQVYEDLSIDRMQTDSEDNDIINRWHKFLGFTLEGKREKMIYDMDYNCWAMIRGRDYGD